MKNKASYTISLVLPQKTAIPYIRAAQGLFSSTSDSYLLSEHSLPHITVCQFECDQGQIAHAIWKEFAKQTDDLSISVRFTGVSFTKGIGGHQEFYWAELVIARDAAIMKAHHLAVTAVQNRGLVLLNEIGDLYYPHLTLARIRLPKTFQSWPDSLLNNPGPLRLDLVPCIPPQEKKL
ncbi:MAG: hypothetical protein A3E80_02885 [Chlamydiae bacterium RIFCSPHIGHO2_12_FULL_49_9]|nr:MAG: hypothetical protein A3E80_02885 [Chlamydiae bacterium RIFCSPHIGHO2_12_FULL_49_9]